MKVCCYLRISTGLQNLDNQRTILQKYVSEKGWEADFYEEVESSRKTRPVKAEMLSKIRHGDYAGLVVTKLDRYARSSRELILEIDELLKKKITFISVGDNLDFSSAAGMLMFNLLCIFADFERSLISFRTKSSLQRLKDAGVRLGRPVGSRDKGKRRKSGYILREARKRQIIDQKTGKFKPIHDYIDHESK